MGLTRGIGLRGASSIGYLPGLANPLISGRSYLAGPPGTSVSSTNTTVVTDGSLTAVVAYITSPCTIQSLTVRTSSSNASSGATVRLGVYTYAENGAPGVLLAQSSAGGAIGDSATNTNYTQVLDSPLIISDPQKVFIVAQHGFVTTGARYGVNSSTAPFATFEGATSVATVLPGGGIVGYSGTAAYASGLPNDFGSATALTTLTDAMSAAFTLA